MEMCQHKHKESVIFKICACVNDSEMSKNDSEWKGMNEGSEWN